MTPRHPPSNWLDLPPVAVAMVAVIAAILAIVAELMLSSAKGTP